METPATDDFVRRTTVIIFLWFLAMLIGGLLLIRYASLFQNVFGLV